VPKADNPTLGPATATASGVIFIGVFCLVLWGDRLLPKPPAPDDLSAAGWQAGDLAPWDRIAGGLPLQVKLVPPPPSKSFTSSYEDQEQLLAALRARAEGRVITPD
jgi:hypothetical protein